MRRFEFHHLQQSEPDTAISILKTHTSLSISELKAAVSKGALWHEKGKSVQRLRRVKKQINTGETLHFYYDAKVLSQISPEAKLIDDCADYSVWFKPNGMLSQGSKWSDHCTITRWAQTHLPGDRACFLVHRLDRATSGIILVAHTKSATKAFGKLFERHDLTKCYQAIVHQPYAQQHSPSSLRSNQSTDSAPFVVTTEVDGKSAHSEFSLIECDEENGLAKYQIYIKTGRKHQIRKHAASLNMPIVGDRLYGLGARDNKQDKENLKAQPDMQLCAVKLGFTCPITGDEKHYQLSEEMTPDLTVISNQLR
ncbi:MAG: RNA pseudouridine synthase [Thalassotalea sp.]|nr:RNA pseudouridine synthase [Thalassotalea sp.]